MEKFRYPARILHAGEIQQWKLEDWTPAPLPPAIAHLVKAAWEEHLHYNPSAKPWPLLTTSGVVIEADGTARLPLSHSDMRQFIGTTSGRSIPAAYREYGVSALAVTISADGYLMIGVRGTQEYGLLQHVIPAGRMRAEEGTVERCIEGEYLTELGIELSEITSLTCIGVVGDLNWKRLNNEFVFLGNVSLTARQIVERAQTAKSRDEHCQILAIPCFTSPSWEGIKNHLLLDPTAFVPTGFAAVALALYYHFGTYIPWEPEYSTYEAYMGDNRLAMINRSLGKKT